MLPEWIPSGFPRPVNRRFNHARVSAAALRASGHDSGDMLSRRLFPGTHGRFRASG